jgi:hypothetical protein
MTLALSWTMRDALRSIRREQDQQTRSGEEPPFVSGWPTISAPTLEALERRGLVELEYDRRRWRFKARLTDKGREVAG